MEFLTELLGFTLKIALVVVAGLVLIAAIARSQGVREGGLRVVDWGARWMQYRARLLQPRQAKQAKKLAKSAKKLAKSDMQGTLWVLVFNGDMRVSNLKGLRESISAIIMAADPKTDQVCVRLKSPGGGVSEYGLAASQLIRLRDAGLRLTVAVEGVAASGGYMMAVVADHIVAAPFAAVGSIGVVAQVPNFHRALKKADIDVEVLTAGKHKRTLTLLGENTEEGREKFKQDLDQIHSLFKAFVVQYRPQLDLEQVAEGDVWFGQDALSVGLIDEVGQIDDWLMQQSETQAVLEVRYELPKTLGTRLGRGVHALAVQLREWLWTK